MVGPGDPSRPPPLLLLLAVLGDAAIGGSRAGGPASAKAARGTADRLSISIVGCGLATAGSRTLLVGLLHSAECRSPKPEHTIRFPPAVVAVPPCSPRARDGLGPARGRPGQSARPRDSAHHHAVAHLPRRCGAPVRMSQYHRAPRGERQGLCGESFPVGAAVGAVNEVYNPVREAEPVTVFAFDGKEGQTPVSSCSSSSPAPANNSQAPVFSRAPRPLFSRSSSRVCTPPGHRHGRRGTHQALRGQEVHGRGAHGDRVPRSRDR